MSRPVRQRRVLPHLDDVGVSAGSVAAWRDLRAAGVVRTASVMVPCPWYPAAVADYRTAPEQDLGIHLTLTSEWSAYRWRPLIGQADAARGGLLDEEGCFHRRPEAVAARADPQAVEDEMAAQIERALSDGIAPTHLDAHMGTAFLPPFVERLRRLAERYGIPVVLCRDVSALFRAVRLPDAETGPLREIVAEAERRGEPVLDRFLIGFAPDGEPAAPFFGSLLDEAGEGAHFLALHANAPGDMAAMAPHMAWPREAEYDLFRNPESARIFAERRFAVVGWRDAARRGRDACA
jgi:predicted glycoside hydrolase/deacetylase ChbG (UPF0249 family)